MDNGIEKLRSGAEALCEWDSPLRERLLFAAMQFWAAYIHQDQWPDSLRRQADPLLRILLQRGRIPDTIASLPEDAVPDLSSRLLEFFELAERVLIGTDRNLWTIEHSVESTRWETTQWIRRVCNGEVPSGLRPY